MINLPLILGTSDTALYSVWAIVLVIAAVVVLLVAALLILILLATRGIERYALASLDSAHAIVNNTKPIWALKDTNRVGGLLLQEVQSIARVGTALADALEHTDHV